LARDGRAGKSHRGVMFALECQVFSRFFSEVSGETAGIWKIACANGLPDGEIRMRLRARP
jgi:hypothetical protein